VVTFLVNYCLDMVVFCSTFLGKFYSQSTAIFMDWIMTLVIFVPHSEGVSLVADRKNIFDDGTFESVTKVFRVNGHRAIIGCAGSTSVFSSIIRRLRGNPPHASVYEEVCEIYGEEYGGFAQTAGQSGLAFTGFDLLVAKYDGASVELECYSSHAQRVFSRPCNSAQCQAIGEREIVSFLTPQFNRINRAVSKQDALQFAQAAIAYSSKVKDVIGNPEDFGCDSLTLKSNGEIEEDVLTYDPSALERFFYFRRA